jgi:hypothetical protein
LDILNLQEQSRLERASIQNFSKFELSDLNTYALLNRADAARPQAFIISCHDC